jgi:hypothetical protein
VRLGLVLLAGLVCGAGVRWVVGRSPDAPAADPGALVVDRSGDAGTFPTIAAAVRAAPPGGRIVVRADSWEEALRVPADGVAAVTIEGKAPGGGPVRWGAPADHPADQPLLRITGRAGLRVRGMVLDGADRLQGLVLVDGPCPGLTLEDLHLTGFRQKAVVFRACSGTADRPVTLRRVRVAPGSPAAAALSFEARADEGNQQLQITDCRLEGPLQAAIVLDGPVKDTVFRENRIWKVGDAFLYRKAAPAHPLGLTLAGNTICAAEKAGLHFEALPPTGRSRVVLTGNVFVLTPTLASLDDLAGSAPSPAQWLEVAEIFPRPSGNVCDKQGREGFPPLKAAVEALELPADAADDARFLRHRATSLPDGGESPEAGQS